MQTIYLRQSASTRGDYGSSGAHPDASLCVDLNGGDFTPGAVVQTWGCNGCWNQQFILGGGVTQLSEWDAAHAMTRRQHVLHPETCPPVPSPPAANCAGGWPSFGSAGDLSASPWGAYLKDVYGGVPQAASYPWCMGDFWVVYTDRLQAHGITPPKSVGECPTDGGKSEGQFYTVNNQFQPSNIAWVWHTATKEPFADNSWVEVIHMVSVMTLELGLRQRTFGPCTVAGAQSCSCQCCLQSDPTSRVRVCVCSAAAEICWG